MSGERILVVDDEPSIADLVRTYLEAAAFEVRVARDGRAALDQVAAFRPAVVLLDVGLPLMDGTEVCRRMRAMGDWTPVLFVTARDDEVDRVVGLELGADDYVTKPFSPRELVSRVRAVLRRSQPVAQASAALTLGTLTVDAAARRVTIGGSPVELTTTEFDLLHYLMASPGRVFSREQLLSGVWGYPAGLVTRTVDVHVAQLRAKVGSAVTLRAVRGVGYSVEAVTA